jgi:hypothetical protein
MLYPLIFANVRELVFELECLRGSSLCSEC